MTVKVSHPPGAVDSSALLACDCRRRYRYQESVLSGHHFRLHQVMLTISRHIGEIMADKKKAYPLRINEKVLAAMQRWADDELRSVNAQIEYVLRDALLKHKRIKLTEKVITEVELQDKDADGQDK